MEKDIDLKLYNEYLNGNKEAFEVIYTKYKKKIEYFVYNIVKDQQKAEDITQEVFIYILKNKIKENCSFKYYIFLIAKSRALNYIKLEKRREEINETYILQETEKIEKDVLETITKEETKKEILQSINMLDDKYKNPMFLVKVEELSYQEAADILGETVQNIKNLIHRGKKELRKILVKKGFYEMNKVSKILVIIICVSVALSSIVYAATQIIKVINKNNNVTFNPSYLSPLEENTINNIWVGTFDLAWKELAKKVGKNEKIELVENVETANELNESTFSKKMLSKEDYIINVSENESGGYDIYSTLNKNLNFLHPFENFNDYYNKTFVKDTDNVEYIKYFGINSGTAEKARESVEVLFYNERSKDFAVTLKTQEGDEIILYRTDDVKAFNEYYDDIEKKTSEYTGKKAFGSHDELLVPYVRVNGRISYNELLGKLIENTSGMYIETADQDVNFYLNEKGCNLQSTATFVTATLSAADEIRYFEFQDTFIIFMKEKDATVPYFALKVDNTNILEKEEEQNEIQIEDVTARNPERFAVEETAYKFYEDESHEYYYPTQKTKYVKVYFLNEKPIGISTVEEALKNGKITIELLDKYGIEYIKKKK